MTVQAVQARLAAVSTADGRFKVLLKWALSLTDDVIDSMGGQKAVADQFVALYDEWIVPLDLPGIPGIAEPGADAIIKRIGVALIWAVDDES